MSKKEGEEILLLAENDAFTFSEVNCLGKYRYDDSFTDSEGDRWFNADEYGDRSFMWEYLS